MNHLRRRSRSTSPIPWVVASALLALAPTAIPSHGAAGGEEGGRVIAAARQDPSGVAAEAGEKLHPLLARAARAASQETVAVWVEFRDKGMRSQAERERALAAAEATLAPRASARRRRAQVHPLVDEYDVPVATRYLEALVDHGWAPVAVSRWLNRAAVRVTVSRLLELAALPFVARIVPVARVQRARAPWNDPVQPPGGEPGTRAAGPNPFDMGTIDYGRSLAPLLQLGLPAVHDSGYVGVGVRVCLLDAGFTYHDRHEALRDRTMAPGLRRDFVDGDSIVSDTTSIGQRHGTWVLGSIAGYLPGQYVGAAFGAEYALARTEDEASETPVEMLYWGMGAEWADSLGADIIASSLGYFTFDGGIGDYRYEDMDGHTTEVTRAAQIAAAKGILVVNAVGNEGNRSWRHMLAPADADGDSVIAVGAVDGVGDTVAFSSAGPTADGRIKPDFAARGLANPVVSATGNPSGYTTLSGTSLATPLVAGLAACLMQARPDWTPQQIIRLMRETASHASRPDLKRGYGIPNGLAALRGAPLATSGGLEISISGRMPRSSADPPVLVRFGWGRAGEPVRARVRVVDLQGRAIRELWSGTLGPGESHTAPWDGRHGDGRRVGPGVYWIALHGDGRTVSVRVVWLG